MKQRCDPLDIPLGCPSKTFKAWNNMTKIILMFDSQQNETQHKKANIFFGKIPDAGGV